MASRISGVSSEWAQSSTALDQTIYKPTMDDRMTDIKNFCYNPENGKIFGIRTPFQWLLMLIYYTCFYIVLFGFFAIVMSIFFWIVDWNYPTLQGVDSILKVPGLSFRPMPNTRSTVVRFVKGDASTYTQYLDHMEAYLRYYENENQQGENYIDCSETRTRRTTELTKVCRFGIEVLGSSCVKQQNFGFDDGQPCILLKLNRIYNWIPEEFTNVTLPQEIADVWEQWSISVKCYGETETDRENMGPLTYHPPNGFPFKYYPFLNQQGYRSPLMFVRFEQPVPGIMLMITCKAYAKNIYHNRVELAGMVHFELLVD